MRVNMDRGHARSRTTSKDKTETDSTKGMLKEGTDCAEVEMCCLTERLRDNLVDNDDIPSSTDMRSETRSIADEKHGVFLPVFKVRSLWRRTPINSCGNGVCTACVTGCIGITCSN